MTNDIPDFVRDSFVNISSSPAVPLKPRTADTFEDKWNELGAILKESWTQRPSSISFSSIRLSDIIDALSQPIPDEHNLWTSVSLAPFIRLTSWTHIQTETGFYELAAKISTPTLLFAFEAPFESPRTFFYGPHELVALPNVVTATTFVFLLQKISTPPSATSVGNPLKKKRNTASSSSSDEDLLLPQQDDETYTCTVQSVEIEVAQTLIPVTERQRMGPPSTITSSVDAPSNAMQISFDLHAIMTRWKQDKKRPTVEKICETEHLAQRDVKRWLEQNNTTWTKMLIQYGFRDTASGK